MDKVAPWEIFHQGLWFSLVSIPPLFHSHILFGEWTLGSSAVQFHREIISLLSNNNYKKKCFLSIEICQEWLFKNWKSEIILFLDILMAVRALQRKGDISDVSVFDLWNVWIVTSDRVTYQKFDERDWREGRGGKEANLIVSFPLLSFLPSFRHSVVCILGSTNKVRGQKRLRLLYTWTWLFSWTYWWLAEHTAKEGG
jgi:hypothetical protein